MCGYALIDTVPQRAGDRLMAEIHLDPARDPFLVQHRFRQTLALPQSIRRLRLARLPRADEKCVVPFTFGDDGSAILAVEGYRSVLVPDESSLADRTPERRGGTPGSWDEERQ